MIFSTEDKIKEFKAKFWKIIDKEKNVYIFKYRWFDCAILRYTWYLNWYVALPKDHLLYWFSYNNYDYDEEIHNDSYIRKVKALDKIDVHWWLTFSWELDSIDIEWYDFTFCYWFDTCHAWDASYDSSIWYVRLSEWDIYRDYEYVLQNVKNMADALYYDTNYDTLDKWIDTNYDTLEDRLEKNYDEIRYQYEDMLIDTGRYNKNTISEVNDWRDEFVEKEYDMYISENTSRYKNK